MNDDRPIMTRAKYPCLNCADRGVKVIDGKPVRCHSYCEKYLSAKEQNGEIEALNRKAKTEYYDFYNYHKGKISRYVKEKRRKL